MTPEQVYKKVNEIKKANGGGISTIARSIKQPVWKYYTGRQRALGLKYGGKKDKKATVTVAPGTMGAATKCVLIMGTPEQIREVLG